MRREGTNHFHQTLAVIEAGELLLKGGSAQAQTKSRSGTTVGTGGRQDGGAPATEHASE